MQKTEISWTDYSWNPLTGCSHAGTPECDNCYARSMSVRQKAQGRPLYINGFTPTFHEEVLKDVAKIPSGSLVFLPSMSDLFHEDYSDDIIEKVVTACESRPDVTFQILTKRSKRMAEFFQNRPVPENCWPGVTCGHESSLFRLEDLRKIQAPVRWISAEPLLSDIAPKLDLTGIDWVVIGGESGPRARIMHEGWVLNIKDKCDEEGVAFFFKQWGSVGPDGIRRKKSENGCLLQGKEHKNYPLPPKIDDSLELNSTDDWATPQAFFDELNNRYHFTLDPCASETNAKCAKYYTKVQDGLKQEWAGEVCWVNPPYSKSELKSWVKKCYDEGAKGTKIALLLPTTTCSATYFHEYVLGKAGIEFVRGRLHFNDGDKAAPFASIIAFYNL